MNSLNLKKMKQIKTLTKSALLEMTLGGWLYIIKIFPNLIKINSDKCKPVINHLRGEKNASLNFHKWKDKWFMKDFAQPKYKGDVFDLYAIVNDIDDVKSNFVEILKGIYRDTFNQEPSEKIGFKNVNKLIEESTLPEDVKYEITERKFSELNKFEKEFLEKYDITIDTMKKLDIIFLSDYTFIAQTGKTYTINSVEQNIIIGHKFNDCVKIYKPNAREYKHQIIGTYNREYFVEKKQFDGLCQNPSLYNDDLSIVFCAGMKDAMVLTELGYLAISLNSETSNLPDYLYSNIRSLQKQIDERIIIKILYDNDETGITQSSYMYGDLLESGINSKIIYMPDRIKEKNGKDVSDWISLGFPKQELIDLIDGKNIKKNDNIIDPSPVSSISSDSYNSEEDYEVTYVDVVEEGAKFPNKKPSRLKNLKNEFNKRTLSKEKINLDVKEETEEIEDEIDNVKFNNSNSLLEIPNEVYDNFPSLLKKALIPFDNKDKTMMALALITAFGSTLKNVKSKLRNNKFYANLYTIIVAPPASGKSLMKWARALILPIEKSLKSQSNKASEDYKVRLNKYKKDEIDRDELGDKPPYKVLLIPADITSAMWVKQMSDNDGYGIMYDTEIDGLIESNSGNLRSFTDYLRKAYENEPLTLMRKTNSERLSVEEGKMSLLLSGTPKQHLKLLPSAENGLFSRIITLNFNGSNDWKSVIDDNDFDFEKHFENLGLDVLNLFTKLDKKLTTTFFKLTNNQLFKLDNEFKKRTDRVNKIAGIDGRATVYRLGPITVKIAMILNMFRRIDDIEIKDEYICSDEDFDSALIISGVILEHVLKTLKTMNSKRLELTYRGNRLDYYYSLPNSFSFRESQQIAVDENVKIKTAEKWIYAFRNDGFLLNPVKGQFQKV